MIEATLVSERKVILPDREILVVGTNHGLYPQPFLGRIHTEQELAENFQGRRLTGLALDSLVPLETQKDFSQFVYSARLIRPDVLNFRQWGVKYAQENGLYLIAADPINLVSNLFTIYQHETASNPSVLVSALAFLAMPQISRRGFFKGSLVVASSLIPQLQTEPSSAENCALTNNDLKIFDSIIREPRVLEREDFKDGILSCIAELFKHHQITIVLRNALIAEVLTLPLTAIVPSGSDKANLAAVMGGFHIITEESLQISWLATHPRERRIVLEEAFSNLFRSVRSGKYGRMDSELMKQEFLQMGRSYRINPDGSFSRYDFAIPALNSIVK